MSDWSKTWTYYEGDWHDGNVPIMGPRDHAAWLGSSVFDGGRSFEGVTPDLDLHCARVNQSAEAMGLKALKSSEEILALAHDGIKKFDPDAALYVRPMYWAQQGGPMAVAADPESTQFCLCIYETPMPPPQGFSVMAGKYRKPTQETAIVQAKAGCLYPNNARALTEAREHGYDNALIYDMLGNVAELATSNIFMVRDGVVFTPAANGTFLSGITRARTIILLREAGHEVREDTLQTSDFEEADEIFSTGNYSKVSPITRFQQREMQPGPIAKKARELYWEWAHS